MKSTLRKGKKTSIRQNRPGWRKKIINGKKSKEWQKT